MTRQKLSGEQTEDLIDPSWEEIAVKRFKEVLAALGKDQQPKSTLVVDDLASKFLAWLKRHRSTRTHYERSRHLSRFCERHGKTRAESITADHLEGFLDGFPTVDWRLKHEVSVRAMFRWGAKHGLLSRDLKPFATLEPTRSPIKALLESDLPTAKQVETLFAHARPELADLLRVQHATGARTGELLKANVGDYQRMAHQIVLVDHKRSKTMREKAPRIITLNSRADGIVSRLCEGRDSREPIFRTPTGKRWRSELLSNHLIRTRRRANLPDHITPYAFRHLWISEALMAGLDAMIVARMAGTSLAMIERVYGRFRLQSLAEAQAKLDASRMG